MEIKEDANGDPVVFSIAFWKKDGELVFIPRAISVGQKNAYETRSRGIMPVDKDMNKTGHIYRISIDRIYKFNNQEVVL